MLASDDGKRVAGRVWLLILSEVRCARHCFFIYQYLLTCLPKIDEKWHGMISILVLTFLLSSSLYIQPFFMLAICVYIYIYINIYIYIYIYIYIHIIINVILYDLCT